MDFDETTLRALLGSPEGPQAGKAIVTAVQTGETVKVRMDDGTQCTLVWAEAAELLLAKRFNWTLPGKA
ncbi:MAG TPA: hypothetical protein DDZ88_20400 [Verrucomicrobiales bacterium]|nr:hypothetical protein [Verrucomicrobiales bacterium]